MFREKICVLLILCFLASPAFTTETGGVEYHDYLFDYANLDAGPIKLQADYFLQTALAENDLKLQNENFHKAMRNYHILLKISPNDVDVMNKRALIYDVMKKDLLSKSYFSRSMNVDENNPQTNFLVGDFFYKRQDFNRALKYYSKALENGFNDYEINYKMAVVYEKLGDLCNAKRFYQEAYNADNSQIELLEKIENIPEENEEYHGTIRR